MQRAGGRGGRGERLGRCELPAGVRCGKAPVAHEDVLMRQTASAGVGREAS